MKSGKARLIALLSMALAAVLVLGGCGAKGTFSSDIIDETGAYRVTAENAGKDSAVGSLGGGILVKEGQIVVASPDFEKGSVQLRLLDANGEVVVDETMEGRVLSTYELEPDDYSIEVTCNKNGTTGTLLVIPVDAAEFEQQGESLIEALVDSIK